MIAFSAMIEAPHRKPPSVSLVRKRALHRKGKNAQDFRRPLWSHSARGGLGMVNQAWPQNIQKMDFEVTTSDGPGRVTIVTGMLPIGLNAWSQGQQQMHKESYKVLLEPFVAPGQFRKATATAALSYIMTSGAPSETQWVIEDAQATLDDDAGQVQLVIDLMAIATAPGGAGGQANTNLYAVNFQVTTLALI